MTDPLVIISLLGVLIVVVCVPILVVAVFWAFLRAIANVFAAANARALRAERDRLLEDEDEHDDEYVLERRYRKNGRPQP